MDTDHWISLIEPDPPAANARPDGPWLSRRPDRAFTINHRPDPARPENQRGRFTGAKKTEEA